MDYAAGCVKLARLAVKINSRGAEAVLALLREKGAIAPPTSIDVAEVSLASFDELLGGGPEVLK